MHRAVLAVGGCLLAAGLLFGLLPVDAGVVDCGSAFQPDDSGAAIQDLVVVGGTVESCQDARQPWFITALVLLFVGGGLVLGSLLAWPRTPTDPA